MQILQSKNYDYKYNRLGIVKLNNEIYERAMSYLKPVLSIIEV